LAAHVGLAAVREIRDPQWFVGSGSHDPPEPTVRPDG